MESSNCLMEFPAVESHLVSPLGVFWILCPCGLQVSRTLESNSQMVWSVIGGLSGTLQTGLQTYLGVEALLDSLAGRKEVEMLACEETGTDGEKHGEDVEKMIVETDNVFEEMVECLKFRVRQLWHSPSFYL